MSRSRAMIRKTLFMAAALGWSIVGLAQDDAVLMTIAGKPVTRGEFEYYYNKNGAEGTAEKLSPAAYAELFVDYRLKVMAAEAAGLDTMATFRQELAACRDARTRPAFVTDADIAAEAHRIYQDTKQRVERKGGLRKADHILIAMRQKASQAEMQAAKQRIDSICNALQNGADFATLARQCSDDKGSAAYGGALPWIEKGQTLKEFEDRLFALKVGEMSAPFESPAGWHILWLKEQRGFFPYDSLKTSIMQYITMRNLREQMARARIDSTATASGKTVAKVLEAKAEELSNADPKFRYLMQEYHDGLLMYEISNRMVWDRAAKDEQGLHQYFAKNKKKYRWDKPRYRGLAYMTSTKAGLAAVKKAIKHKPFERWETLAREAFGADSTRSVRCQAGLFKQGDNALVDYKVFKDRAKQPNYTAFPYMGVYGKKLKGPEKLEEARQEVVADYQEMLEEAWVKQLRKRYPVTIDQDVLKTVNQH